MLSVFRIRLFASIVPSVAVAPKLFPPCRKTPVLLFGLVQLNVPDAFEVRNCCETASNDPGQVNVYSLPAVMDDGTVKAKYPPPILLMVNVPLCVDTTPKFKVPLLTLRVPGTMTVPALLHETVDDCKTPDAL